MTTHEFCRHGDATLLRQAGASLDEIRELVRHRRVVTTQRNISNAQLSALIEANLAAVLEALEAHRFVGLRDDDLILHLDH